VAAVVRHTVVVVGHQELVVLAVAGMVEELLVPELMEQLILEVAVAVLGEVLVAQVDQA
jgi:hypothetical protein